MKKIFFILLFCFQCFLTFNQSANAAVNDFGLWNGVRINLPITKKIDSRFYVSPRLLDNATDFNQLIVHALLGYKLRENLIFYQGYAWSTTYIPNFKREERPYQDLVYKSKFKKLSLENRFRFEERFLQDIEGISLRSRYRIKGSYPIDKKGRWNLVLFDEIFVNLNSHFAGPQAGIDQNRIFVGINRKLSENVDIEGGYQLQHLHKKGSLPDALNHFILVNLNVNLPQILK